ncbi:MAG: double-cubane-cluster-containing anaerobic reductase [Planctomycetota bacterium]
MTECTSDKNTNACCNQESGSRFDNMIQNCYDYASQAHAAGQPIIGIMCEYTPRELIMAAGAIPVCLCGGSEEKITHAETDLPTGLCPLIKSTYGYYRTQTNPFLEMAAVIVAETTCDGKKKMYELMAERKEMYILELPQKPDDPDAMEHWVRELHKFREYLQVKFGTAITDDDLRNAIETMNRERQLRRKLAEMNQTSPPTWTGQQLLAFKSIISGIEEDLQEYQRLSENGSCSNPCKSRPRVLLTGVPTVHGAEKVIDLIEKAGGTVVCMENCTGVKPIVEDIAADTSDPMRTIAEKYFHLPCSVMTANSGRIDLLKTLIADYRPDCIVDLVWQGCLTYDVEAYWIKQLADEAKLPYLKIVTDYSPSDAARLALRVEALLETAGQSL